MVRASCYKEEPFDPADESLSSFQRSVLPTRTATNKQGKKVNLINDEKLTSALHRDCQYRYLLKPTVEGTGWSIKRLFQESCPRLID